jgi:hypothetical protein
MRFIATLIIAIYIGGIAYHVVPIFSDRWNRGTPAELFAAVWADIPNAVTWPVAAYHYFAGDRASVPAPVVAPAVPTPTDTPKP